MEKIKILGILPCSIGGRLTMNSFFNGFKKNGVNIEVIDNLTDNQAEFADIDKYDFIIGYDYDAIKFKEKYNASIKTANYFSDVINSDFCGKDWNNYYNKLLDEKNYTFYWDKSHSEVLKNEIKNLFYLPHAVDTDIYKNFGVIPEYDVMFAGRLTHHGRLENFIKLLKALPDAKFALYCHPKHLEQNLQELNNNDADLLNSVYKGFIETEEDMAKNINNSKIIINFNNQGLSSLNYRTFQAMACERLLISDYREEIDNLFTPNEDIICYKNNDELISLIKYYLNNQSMRISIGKKARNTIVEKYDATIAAHKILETILK